MSEANEVPISSHIWVVSTTLTAYFSESIKDMDVKFLHNLQLNLQCMLSKFVINIFDSLETMCFSAT